MLALFFAAALSTSSVGAVSSSPSTVIPISSWLLASSANVTANGSVISLPNYDPSPAFWYPVVVPSTVMGGLLQNGWWNDILSAQNLFTVNTSLFDVLWLYRAAFTLPPHMLGTSALRFLGINYRAQVWVNGVEVVSADVAVGAFRHFEVDVTQLVTPGQPSAIAVAIARQHDRSLPSTNHDVDLGITFVDWAPPPPDSSLGLWQGVELVQTAGPVRLRYPFVSTTLSAAASPQGPTPAALLTVAVEVSNSGSTKASGRIVGAIYAPTNVSGLVEFQAEFSQPYTLDSGDSTTVIFSPDDFPQLVIQSPQLWWPWQMGKPVLHTLELLVTFDSNRSVSDAIGARFGIREVTSSLDGANNRAFFVNSVPILIRGAGWAPDLFLRYSSEHLSAAIAYTRDMGLNTIRLEGKMEPDEFYDLADQAGLLVLPGWCCCDAWQHWNYWGPEQYNVSAESQATQARRLRIHPSVFTFFISSDELPPPDVEAEYRTQLGPGQWVEPIVSAASAANSSISGPTGVKMSGPYSWVPPNYWLTDPGIVGGAFGFLTEGGPGENPMVFESLAKTVSPAALWPPSPDDCWGHCANPQGALGTLARFNGPLAERYGVNASNISLGARSYLYAAHAQAYEGHRAMFEGYSRNKGGAGGNNGVVKPSNATGVIQWMLNSAWPSNVWQLFDFYLEPGPAYFATKLACELTHIMYAYDDARVYAINSAYRPVPGPLWAEAQLLTPNASVFASASASVPSGLDADAVVALFSLPMPAEVLAVLGPGRTYLVALSLREGTSSGRVLSQGTYWLSTSPDVLDWNASTYLTTPCSAFADFRDLLGLGPAQLDVVTEFPAPGVARATISLHSDALAVAFLVRARLISAHSGDPILPALWSDNYLVIRPGETRELFVDYSHAIVPQEGVKVIVESFNDYL